jgi:hypothetical protein
MMREGVEKIGVRPIWLHYISLEYPEAHIAFFASRSQAPVRRRTQHDRRAHVPPSRHRHRDRRYLGRHPNLRFLVPMGIHALAHENIVPTTVHVYGEANAISEFQNAQV